MGRTDIAEAPSANSFPDIEKLNLDAGEKARIYMVEGSSWLVEYAHELRNKAKPTKAEEQAGAKSSPQDFYGNFLCLGDPNILKAGDPDPERCPFCAAAPTSGGKVLQAKPGYATNIIRYNTSKGSHEATRPVGVKVVAWVHRDDRKRRIIKDLGDQWGDLKARDLTITCNNQFQQYDIGIAAQSAFELDPSCWPVIQETFEYNKYDDAALTQALGRRVDQDGAARAIRAVFAAGQQEHAAPSAAYVTAGAAPQMPQAAPMPGAVPVAAPAPVPVPQAVPVAAPPMPAPVVAPVAPPMPAPVAPAPVDLGGLGAPPAPDSPYATPPTAEQVAEAVAPAPVAAPPMPAPVAAPVAPAAPVAAPVAPPIAAPVAPAAPVAAPVAPPVPQAPALPPMPTPAG